MKPIPGYEGLYSVTKDGKVWSHKRKGQWLKAANMYGYLSVNLKKNGIGKAKRVHRLVALTYIKKIKGKNIINHINNIKDDNRVENLEWVTQRENIHKALASGINFNSGIKQKFNKKTQKEIVKLAEQRIHHREIAKKYNCSYWLISETVRRAVKRGETEPAYKKLSKKMIADIIEERKKGKTMRELGIQFNCSTQAIYFHLSKNYLA